MTGGVGSDGSSSTQPRNVTAIMDLEREVTNTQKKQKCKGVFHMYFENKINKRELKNKEIYKAIKKNESSLVGIESS